MKWLLLCALLIVGCSDTIDNPDGDIPDFTMQLLKFAPDCGCSVVNNSELNCDCHTSQGVVPVKCVKMPSNLYEGLTGCIAVLEGNQ